MKFSSDCPFATAFFLGCAVVVDACIHLSISLRILHNMGVAKDLSGAPLPLELFTGQAKTIKLICYEQCSALCNNIVMQLDRHILRQSSRKRNISAIDNRERNIGIWCPSLVIAPQGSKPFILGVSQEELRQPHKMSTFNAELLILSTKTRLDTLCNQHFMFSNK